MAGDSLTRSEDYLLERKTKNDLKDLLKTMVAFANTVRSGHVATILIGERDDGTPEDLDPDSIQKTVRKEADRIYPPIIWRSVVYENAERQCVRVEIEHSGDTPHFGGLAWVRRGSVTVLASPEEFQRLIDLRSSIVYELDQWIGKQVTVELASTYEHGGAIRSNTYQGLLKFVNRFYVTLEYASPLSGTHPQLKPGIMVASFPLKSVTICWDDPLERLKVIVEQPVRLVP